MENALIADIFDEFADLIELKGGNGSRVRSFRSAARIVRDDSERLETLSDVAGERGYPSLAITNHSPSQTRNGALDEKEPKNHAETIRLLDDDLNFIRFGLSVARRGWLEKEDLLNTNTAKQLRNRPGRS